MCHRSDGSHPDDAVAIYAAQAIISSPNRAAALAALSATGQLDAQVAVLQAGLTDAQHQALQLWLINLLPTWGRLLYMGWVKAPPTGAASSGLLVTRPVRQLLYGVREGRGVWVAIGVGSVCARGPQVAWLPAISRPSIPAPVGYEDGMLRTIAAGASPDGYRLVPWTYTQMTALAFPAITTPADYFSEGV